MRAIVASILALSAAMAAPSPAQWHVGVEIAVNRYGGSAHDTSSSHVASQGRPGDATALSLRVGRDWRRFGLALRGSHSRPGLAVTGERVNLTDKSSGDLLELAWILSTRVGGIGPSGAVKLELGPALHLWDYEGDIRSRVSGSGAAAYEWALVGRFTGVVRLEGLLSGSWFDAGDVPPEFERRVTWRYGVGLGLRYRL